MEMDIPYIASMGIRRIHTALFGEYICAVFKRCTHSSKLVPETYVPIILKEKAAR